MIIECGFPTVDGGLCTLPETHGGECRHVYSDDEEEAFEALRHDLAVLEEYARTKGDKM